ncbi:MAG: hypothetical protein ACOCRO_05740, partial [Halanaerobiales bacterium]
YLENEETYEVLLFNSKVIEEYGTRIENSPYEPIIVSVLRNPKGLCLADGICFVKDFQERLETGEGFTEFEKIILEGSTDGQYEKVFKRFGLKTAKELSQMSQEQLASHKMMKQPIKAGGVITKNFEYEAKNGLMSFASFKSGGYNMELLVWADAYKKFKPYLKVGTPVAMKLLPSDKEKQFMVDVRFSKCKIVPLDNLKSK